mgnify:CR=1 FL=1|jgi:DNA-binding MarR family transcriptional regulator
MNHLDNMPDRQFLFGALFVAANRVDTLMQRELKKYDVTTKQWLLSIVIDNLFQHSPTIKEVAKEMGSSHQNVKQIALKMARKGLLKMERDHKDARAVRLRPTGRNVNLWKRTKKEGDAFTAALFADIDGEALHTARSVMAQMLRNIAKMDRGD